MSLAGMTVSGGALIGFTLVLRGLAGRRLPRGVFLALWELAALRLLVPLAVPSPLSVYALAGRYLPEAGAAAGPGAGGPARAVWIAGAVALGLWFAAAYLWRLRKFRRAAPCAVALTADPPPRRGIRVRVSAEADSPLTYGVLRPVLLLPEGWREWEEETLDLVLRHEYVHVRRLDALWKLLFAAALCVHWFNPLVWAMAALVGRDMELSCDEAVLRRAGEGARRTYALALLRLEERRAAGPGLCFGRPAVEERLAAIVYCRRRGKLAALFGVALAVLAASALCTVPVEGEAAPEEEAQKVVVLAADPREKSPSDCDGPRSVFLLRTGEEVSLSILPLEGVGQGSAVPVVVSVVGRVPAEETP